MVQAAASVLVALLLLGSGANAESAVPPLRARVTDLADLLPPDAQRSLEQRLAAFERETSHQIAVLTIPSLEGEAIESFSLRAVEAWKLGRADADNGILLLVAARDRRARIEVGYGLVGAVPDIVAKRVLEDVLFPRFRAGDFEGGIDAATTALMQAARGEEVSALTRPERRDRPGGDDPVALVLFSSVLGMFAALPFRSATKRRPLAALVAGGVAAGLAHLFLGMLSWTLLGLALGALLGWFGPITSPGRPGGLGGLGGWRGGRGGFGGGGGRFGGGGASGSW